MSFHHKTGSGSGVCVGVGSGSVFVGGSVSKTGAAGPQEDRIISKRMKIIRHRMVFIIENAYHLIKPGQKPGARKPGMSWISSGT